MFKLADKLVEKVSPSKLDPMGLGQTYWKFWRSVLKNPGDLMARNIQLAYDQLSLLTYGVKKTAGLKAGEVIAPEKGDRRFNNPAWSEQVVFDICKQSYLLTSKYLTGLAGNAGLDKKNQHKLEFFTRQMVDALSPANFASAAASWKATGGGFKYRDTDLTNDGVKIIRLKPGDGSAKIIFKGQGAPLGLGPLPLALPVTAQLTDGATCWESTFDDARRNDPDQFKAKR